jgi:hypothetical protein
MNNFFVWEIVRTFTLLKCSINIKKMDSFIQLTVFRFQIIRDITIQECPWLPRDFKIGEEVFDATIYSMGSENSLYNYGAGAQGISCSEEEGIGPFFELPLDSLKVIK